MKVKAFEILQKGTGEGVPVVRIYVTALSAGIIAKKAKIDRWSPKNREGYQRPPSESRLSERRKGSIVHYILRELGTLPTSILLNIRKGVKFEKEIMISNNISFGDLYIPDEEDFWVIDGQHRIEALKKAMIWRPELREYPLPVSILVLDDKFMEMLHFYIVNSRAKGVPTRLAYRHLQRMVSKYGLPWVKELITPSEEIKGRASTVVDILAEDPDSPFKGKIQYLDQKEGIIKDSTLIREIARLFKESIFKGVLEEELAEYLKIYWKAVAKVWPRAFRDPKRYSLLKSTGIATLTRVFPIIYLECLREGFSEECVKKYLEFLKEDLRERDVDLSPDFQRPINDEWWSTEKGPAIARATSEAMFKTISEHFIRKIRIVKKFKK